LVGAYFLGVTLYIYLLVHRHNVYKQHNKIQYVISYTCALQYKVNTKATRPLTCAQKPKLCHFIQGTDLDF